MKGINIGKWLIGGIAGGALIWVIEGISSMFYMHHMEEVLESHSLKVEVTTATFAISVLASLVSGLLLVFFYAAARPRFGAGPLTAVIVAVAIWIGAFVPSLLGYHMFGLFPVSLLTHWGLVGLGEMIAASLLGGWIYREP